MSKDYTNEQVKSALLVFMKEEPRALWTLSMITERLGVHATTVKHILGELQAQGLIKDQGYKLRDKVLEEASVKQARKTMRGKGTFSPKTLAAAMETTKNRAGRLLTLLEQDGIVSYSPAGYRWET